MLMIALQGYAICPAGLEPPAGARNRKKIYYRSTTKRPLRGDVKKPTIPKSSNNNVF